PWEWDLKRLTASVVVAGRHLRLRENESLRAAGATVQAYREQMADYAFMKALDVWYDRIDLESLIDRVAKGQSEETRARAEERLEKARTRSVAEHDFPKLVEHHGASPLINDNPPLIFHPSEEQAP